MTTKYRREYNAASAEDRRQHDADMAEFYADKAALDDDLSDRFGVGDAMPDWQEAMIYLGLALAILLAGNFAGFITLW